MLWDENNPLKQLLVTAMIKRISFAKDDFLTWFQRESELTKLEKSRDNVKLSDVMKFVENEIYTEIEPQKRADEQIFWEEKIAVNHYSDKIP